MPLEIERKFLVVGSGWDDGSPGARMTQGYLAKGAGTTVRVRICGHDEAWLTIKGRPRGISRPEFEYPIPVAEARDLLDLCDGPPIDKTRHRVEFRGHVWEVDVFHGANEGLVVAEVELEAEEVDPPLPPWVGREVSQEARYYNSRLVAAPYASWSPEERGA
jgi:adenylate cyclase